MDPSWVIPINNQQWVNTFNNTTWSNWWNYCWQKAGVLGDKGLLPLNPSYLFGGLGLAGSPRICAEDVEPQRRHLRWFGLSFARRWQAHLPQGAAGTGTARYGSMGSLRFGWQQKRNKGKLCIDMYNYIYIYTAGGGGSPRGRQSGSLNWRKNSVSLW